MAKDVFRIPGKTWWVKYSQELGWGCDTGDGPLWFELRGIFMPLLPLLELDFQTAARLVENSVRQTGLPFDVAEAFPFEDVIVYALDWETEYWTTTAVHWLEDGFPMSDRINKSLRKLSEKRHFQQRIRHRAIALARKWERNNV